MDQEQRQAGAWRFTEPPARPCWHCAHFAGIGSSGVHALCHQGGHRHLEASPLTGCVFFQRDPGADDDPLKPPPGLTEPLPVGWICPKR